MEHASIIDPHRGIRTFGAWVVRGGLRGGARLPGQQAGASGIKNASRDDFRGGAAGAEGSPGATVADFCRHADARIREALQHQRYPVHALERKAHPRLRQPANRVSINFMPSKMTMDFAGVEASASFTNPGQVGEFGLIFSAPATSFFSARRATKAHLRISTSLI